MPDPAPSPTPALAPSLPRPLSWLIGLRGLAVALLAALALALTLLAQGILREGIYPWDAAIIYLVALAVWLRALAVARPIAEEAAGWRAEAVPQLPALALAGNLPLAVGFALLAWLLLGGEAFNRGALVAWLASAAFLVQAVVPGVGAEVRRWLILVWQRLQDGFVLRCSPSRLALGGILVVALFFRVYHLPEVPAEMTSDHVEKLLDVRDILSGRAPLFFPRNTGREPLEFYLAALVAHFTGLRHLTLQIVTITASLAAVVATYWLGRELLSTRVGLLAALLMAVSRWDVTLARTGLRFSLTTLFVALTLLCLLRALRTQQPRDYLLCGAALGLGLLGYSNFRIVPVLVVLLVALALTLPVAATRLRWRQTVAGLGVLGAMAALVVLPLVRYAVAHPDQFWGRALSRLGPTERPLPGEPLTLLLGNLKDALLMFNWRGDIGWVHNIHQAPALDTLTGTLFALGYGYAVVRLVRQRPFWAAFLVVSLPVLLLPSALSLAFPVENPSFNRASGAIPVVAITAALVPASLWQWCRRYLPGSLGMAVGLAVLAALFAPIARENFHLYFDEFAHSYRQMVPNSSEIGRVARSYADALGGPDHIFILSYPHWVDHRAVGLHMGDSTWSNVLMDPRQVAQQPALTGGKVYLVHPQDETGLRQLRQAYPTGVLLRHQSAVAGKDFLIFLITS